MSLLEILQRQILQRQILRRQPRGAGAYNQRNNLILHPIHGTKKGLGLAGEPVSRISASATVTEVGETLLAALASSRHRVSEPPDWKQFRASFLRATGFRSWKALEKGALYCEVSDDGQTLTIQPTRNGGARGPNKGFSPIGASAIRVPSASEPSVIGEALLDGFHSST